MPARKRRKPQPVPQFPTELSDWVDTVKAARAAKEVTQAELAARCGVGLSAIKALESKRVIPTADLIIAVCVRLNVRTPCDWVRFGPQ